MEPTPIENFTSYHNWLQVREVYP